MHCESVCARNESSGDRKVAWLRRLVQRELYSKYEYVQDARGGWESDERALEYRIEGVERQFTALVCLSPTSMHP